jgi:hypothetical protein
MKGYRSQLIGIPVKAKGYQRIPPKAKGYQGIPRDTGLNEGIPITIDRDTMGYQEKKKIPQWDTKKKKDTDHI